MRMIIDAYTTTRTSSSIEIRIITDTPDSITVSLKKDTVHKISPEYQFENSRFFFRYNFQDLFSDTEYTIYIKAVNHLVLKSSTLVNVHPEKLFRFALFGDPHVAGRDTQAAFPLEKGPRLYSKALYFLDKYSDRAAEHGAAFIVLLGDIADPATVENMKNIKAISEKSPIPWFPIIGNHEPYCSGGEERFNTVFGLPGEGYYSKTIKGRHFIFLSTPSQSSLYTTGHQYSWLIEQLRKNADKDCFLFSHFASLLHPCVLGHKNDGMQELHNSREILYLLKKYPQVKGWFAGHKNIPSLVIKNNIAHFLSPQMIQAPCGFDIVDVYENGLSRTYHEIDEQHFVWIARVQGKDSWEERCGTEHDRNAVVEW